MTEPTAAILHQQIVLSVSGQPDVKNKYGSGHIRPTEITLRYTPSGMRAHVHGRWVREDGEATNAPCSNDYAAHEDDVSEWPDWLAALAGTWRPAYPAGTQPRRGDAFEAWLKKERDDYASDRANDPAAYDALDDLLDRYRLHADTGTPLGEHVCEGQVVGDCEFLEQPAAGARQGEEA
jgi:hypothetical protein